MIVPDQMGLKKQVFTFLIVFVTLLHPGFSNAKIDISLIETLLDDLVSHFLQADKMQVELLNKALKLTI